MLNLYIFITFCLQYNQWYLITQQGSKKNIVVHLVNKKASQVEEKINKIHTDTLNTNTFPHVGHDLHNHLQL